MSKDYKYFALDNKENFIIYLKFLIEHTQIHMRSHKRYLKEIAEVIEKMELREDKKKKIDSTIYIDLRYKIMKPQDMLLNLLGDETKSALSYRKFRVLVKRKMKKNNLDLGLVELSDEMWHLLKEFNIWRNWGLHMPESLLVANIEVQRITAKEKNIVFKKEYNPIKNTVFNYYEAGWIISLHEECSNIHNGFSKVFQQMKKDYSKLIGESLRIEDSVFDVRPLEDMNIPKISGDIQRNKYDGNPKDIWLDFVDIKKLKK